MVWLQREHGNPRLGLPLLSLLLVLPLVLFVAMFHLFNSLKPVDRGGASTWVSQVGLPADTVQQIASAKLLGVSLSMSFTSDDDLLSFIGADGTNVKIAAITLGLLLGTVTFLPLKKTIARTGPVDPQRAMANKILLYGWPTIKVAFGFLFPVGVLLYCLTADVWIIGRRSFVARATSPPSAAAVQHASVPGAVAVSKPQVGVKPAYRTPYERGRYARSRARRHFWRRQPRAGGRGRRWSPRRRPR
jgi:YidC/Oxa1 family membrane protein insertase